MLFPDPRPLFGEKRDQAPKIPLPGETPISQTTQNQSTGQISVAPWNDWNGEIHVFGKAFYHVRGIQEDSPQTGDDAQTGYLRGRVRAKVDYDNEFFFFATGRATAWKSSDFRYGGFARRWLSSEAFDVYDGEFRWNRGETTMNSLDFREIWFKYEGNQYNVKAGRQVINWGEGRFFNPLNTVTRASPYTLEMDEVRGSDGISATWFFSGDTFMNLVWTAHNSLNYYDSSYERLRKRSTVGVEISDPLINRTSWIEFQPETVLLDRQWQQSMSEPQKTRYQTWLSLTQKQGELEERDWNSLYQDVAYRIKGPISPDMDLSFITGWKARRSYAGFDWTGTYFGAGYRAGVVAYSAMKMDSDTTPRLAVDPYLYQNENQSFVQAYAGTDYTFSRYLTMAAQLFYNSAALKDHPWTALGLQQIMHDRSSRDAYDFMRGGYVTYNPLFLNLSASGDVTDLVGYQTYIFIDVEGSGVMGFASLSVSLTDSLVVEAGGRLYSTVGKRSDFSGMQPDAYIKAEVTFF